jgi:hypothetical protein
MMGRPTRLPGAVRRKMLLDKGLVDFGHRGFRIGDPAVRNRLEKIGSTVLDGFDTVVRDDTADPVDQLGEVDVELRPWAYEGAGMACAMLDVITVSRGRRIRTLLEGSGDPYMQIIHVGIGMAMGQMHLPGWGVLRGLDPVMRWLVVEGHGFSQGFFHMKSRLRPDRMSRPRKRAIEAVGDQGLGRSLWFIECADVTAIADRVDMFHPSRRGDLWSGLGLAAGFAGGVDAAALNVLVHRSDMHRADLVQGATFAAMSRHRSGYIPPQTELALSTFAGVDGTTAATWGEDAVAQVEAAYGTDEPAPIVAFERVRELVRVAYHKAASEAV